jgi:expansin (peptidoglycan-binding protein)
MSVGVSPIVDQINFQASDIPNISSYTSLFDQYRIVTVSAIFKPRATQLYTGNSSGDVPWITTAIDVNDNSVNLVPADRYQSALSTQMTTAFVRRLVPKTAVPVYNGLTSAYMQGRSGWLDCGYTAVPHYQLVVNIGATSLDNQFVYEVDVLYTLQFKLVK